MAECKYCGVEVWWLRHVQTGKVAPIDTEPAPNGNVVVSRADGQYRLATATDDEREPRYLNHHVTCARKP